MKKYTLNNFFIKMNKSETNMIQDLGELYEAFKGHPED